MYGSVVSTIGTIQCTCNVDCVDFSKVCSSLFRYTRSRATGFRLLFERGGIYLFFFFIILCIEWNDACQFIDLHYFMWRMKRRESHEMSVIEGIAREGENEWKFCPCGMWMDIVNLAFECICSISIRSFWYFSRRKFPIIIFLFFTASSQFVLSLHRDLGEHRIIHQRIYHNYILLFLCIIRKQNEWIQIVKIGNGQSANCLIYGLNTQHPNNGRRCTAVACDMTWPKVAIENVWFMCDPLLIYFLHAVMQYIAYEILCIYCETNGCKGGAVPVQFLYTVYRMPMSISNHNIYPYVYCLYMLTSKSIAIDQYWSSLVNAIEQITIDKWRKKNGQKNKLPHKNH